MSPMSLCKNLQAETAAGAPPEEPKPGFLDFCQLEGRLHQVATRISFPEEVPIMISQVVHENMMLSVSGQLREALCEDGFPLFSVGDSSFAVLPFDSSAQREVAVAFTIAKLPDADAFIGEQGQAKNAPRLHHSHSPYRRDKN